MPFRSEPALNEEVICTYDSAHIEIPVLVMLLLKRGVVHSLCLLTLVVMVLVGRSSSTVRVGVCRCSSSGSTISGGRSRCSVVGSRLLLNDDAVTEATSSCERNQAAVLSRTACALGVGGKLNGQLLGSNVGRSLAIDLISSRKYMNERFCLPDHRSW